MDFGKLTNLWKRQLTLPSALRQCGADSSTIESADLPLKTKTNKTMFLEGF